MPLHSWKYFLISQYSLGNLDPIFIIFLLTGETISHNIREVKTNGHYLKDFQFVFIELPKFAKNRVEELESTIERWCFFFKYAEDTTDEDLRNIAEKSPIIKLAYDELDKFRWNEKDLIAYEERLMDLRKEEGILAQKLDDATEKGIKIGKEEGRKEGREEGIQIGEERGIKIGHQKGREEGKIEVAKNLLKAGVSVDIIAQTTGLPGAEIAQLKEEVTS
jgi:predicted transposase/invertase (TIGR01784 family)